MLIADIKIKLFRDSDLSNTCKHIDRGKTIARDKFSRLIYKSGGTTFFGGVVRPNVNLFYNKSLISACKKHAKSA